MPEESTTPDPVEVARRMLDAINRNDLDAVGSFYATDAILDRSHVGLEVVQGREAVLQLLASLWEPFDDLRLEEQEITDFGNGVGFAVYEYRGRLRKSAAVIQMRFATVGTGSNGLLDRVVTYTDVDEARAAAERLAEERG